MSGEFVREVPCGRGMTRQIWENRTAWIYPRVGIALADHSLFTRLGQALDENEFPAAIGHTKRYPRPPGEHVGKARDVVLRITGAGSERVQLKNFTREVFV